MPALGGEQFVLHNVSWLGDVELQPCLTIEVHVEPLGGGVAINDGLGVLLHVSWQTARVVRFSNRYLCTLLVEEHHLG